MPESKLPKWDLSNVYPGLDSDEFLEDFENLEVRLIALTSYFEKKLKGLEDSYDLGTLMKNIGEYIHLLNVSLELYGKVRAYLNSFIATDSYNQTARKLYSKYEKSRVELQKQEIHFQSWLSHLNHNLDGFWGVNETVAKHKFYLTETIEQGKFLMSEVEEDIAAELNTSGALAWNKLQGTMSSQLKIPFEINDVTRELPMPALINLRNHPDEDVRKRAYYTEIETWEKVKEPFAAALNGVKGSVLTIDLRRGRKDALHRALDSYRIDRETLEVMLDAMRSFLPSFHRYFSAKAALLGKQKLAWWDIFAPIGSKSVYSYDQAQELILENFSQFSPELTALAKTAFDNNWIDAEQRDGKRGGAFCMYIPEVGESRILCNFDGSLDQVFTIAHELGHAFHNQCMINAGKTELQRQTPMTMAETASIMCETIIFEAMIKKGSDTQEQLAMLDSSLISDSQVIVDIYSRYLFELEVFERRNESELSASDLCDIMEHAQIQAYGDGLDHRYLHKYMWTWKPHYYYPDRSFYNFPYAFGLLFGIGLYAIYLNDVAKFIPQYIKLLASTGEHTVADLASRFSINLKESNFWKSSLAIINARIEKFCNLANLN